MGKNSDSVGRKNKLPPINRGSNRFLLGREAVVLVFGENS